MQRSPTIRLARPQELAPAARLLADVLGFAARDAIPAWLMRTTDECGGITLVALEGPAVVGVSYAFPALHEGEPFLFSCGLAVAREQRGRWLGLALKLEQRRRARTRGYASIRWTTDPLNGRALRLYLTGLGARIVGYREGLHDGLREDPGHPLDDVEVDWPLDGGPRLDEHAVRRVELPWSSAGGDVRDGRVRVRAAMSTLLADGYVGCGVDLNRADRRCWVSFARVAS